MRNLLIAERHGIVDIQSFSVVCNRPSKRVQAYCLLEEFYDTEGRLL